MLTFLPSAFFGTTISEKTKTGFTTSQATVDGYLAALKRKGNLSELNDALDISMVGLSYQSIIDMIIKTNDTTGNISRADTIRQYLQSINSLRLNDIKSRYKTETSKQNTLAPQPGYTTGYTIYLTLNGTTRYIWSTSIYPYAEVVKNGIILTPTVDYTISPTLGKLDLVIELTSNDTLEVNLRQDWDGTAATIAYSEDPRYFMVERWAKTYIPLLLCVSDGDNVSSEILANIISNSDTLWNDLGIQSLLFSNSSSANQKNLLPLTVEAKGKYFQINSNSDWTDTINSLLPGGVNNIFKGTWSRKFSYDLPQFVKYVYNSSVVSSGELIDSTAKSIINNPHVKAKIQEEIYRLNKHFGSWEQVKKFVLLENEFSIHGGELTPTLKLKRKVILKKYADEYESIYQDMR